MSYVGRGVCGPEEHVLLCLPTSPDELLPVGPLLPCETKPSLLLPSEAAVCFQISQKHSKLYINLLLYGFNSCEPLWVPLWGERRNIDNMNQPTNAM